MTSPLGPGARPPIDGGLAGRLDALAVTAPDRLALVDDTGRRLDRRSLVAAVDTATTVLADLVEPLGLGVEQPPGGRLAMFLPNRSSWVIAQFAADRLGIPIVGLNTRFRHAELDHLCAVADIRAVVVAEQFLGIDAAALFEGLTAPPLVIDETILLGGDTAPATTSHATRPASTGPATRECIGFTTSGTTGFPKVAMHDLAGSLHHLDAAAAAMGDRAETVALVPLPLCGTFGWMSAFAPLLAGSTVVLQETWAPERAATAVVAEGVTTFNGADTMLAELLDALGPAAASSTLTDGVFADFANGGAEVAARAELVTEGRLRLTGVYGSSEGFALMSRWDRDEPIERRQRNGGRLVSPRMAVRAVDPETGTVLPDGEPGELQFRGPNLLVGYAGNPEATANAFDGEWFRSGDLGTTIDDATFVYRARMGDSLRLRGFLCDPSEIEHHLEAHPAVDLAQVVGATLPGAGDVAVAFVRAVEDASPTAGELIAWCRSGLANYKCPAHIELVEEFPVTDGPNGVKIRKVDLRARAADWAANQR